MDKKEIEECILVILKRFKTGDLDYDDSLKLIMSYVNTTIPIYNPVNTQTSPPLSDFNKITC